MVKVLIVDDQPEVRMLVRMVLDTGDYRLSEVASGDEALARLDTEAPDILVLDVMMPGELDGYGVCERIKRDPARASTFVLLLSARGQRSDLEQGKQAGADAYLVKPFNPPDLLRIVEQVRLALPPTLSGTSR